MSARLLSWWSEREPRERLLLAVLGALAGLFALVFFLVLPVMDARTDAERALDRARADLAAVSRLGPI
ncbi:MAG: type II secretion system protein GspM, partial [Litorimonas sp.]